MELIRDPHVLRALTDGRRDAGQVVALIPTMGALHAGHDALIERARREHDVVVVTIFVNPLQFEAGEDLDRYPRDEAADLARCAALGADAVWAPGRHQMYPPGMDLPHPDPGPVGASFEGADRPGHLAGVLTAVHRLFDVTGPCVAYFGEKDAQQLFLVRRMVAGEGLSVQIVACPTVRDPDGLAVSSRNERLSDEERAQAGCLFLGLSEAAALARSGERNADALVAVIAREVGATPLARLDHAAVIDAETFLPVTTIGGLGGSARALVAARFPNARLIDNLLLPTGEVVAR